MIIFFTFLKNEPRSHMRGKTKKNDNFLPILNIRCFSRDEAFRYSEHV